MTALDHRSPTFTEPTGPAVPPPMPAPTDLHRKRPAQIVPTGVAYEARISDKGRWVVPFVVFGLPILFVVMLALGFITTR